MEFILADGDGIGDRMELLLLDHRTEDAQLFSGAIQSGIVSVSMLIREAGHNVIFAGGDEILAVTMASFSDDLLQKLRQTFYAVVGCTLSIGVGSYPSAALAALRRAKLQGKNQIVLGG